jgi:ABC-type transport system involved in cytochrome c biogenesis permease subunit
MSESASSKSLLRTIFEPLASLRLTVFLFALSMLLVFFGTLAQIDNGIWTVVEQYFWSWKVDVKFDLFAKFGKVFFPLFVSPKASFAGVFPFPGGKLIGLIMLINLMAAHIIRFKLAWNRCGILMIHGGMILMLVGEAITREQSVEQRMTIEEGMGTNYAEDSRNLELSFLDVTNPDDQTNTVVPLSMLRTGKTISNPDLPVDLHVIETMANSTIERATKDNLAKGNRGIATDWNARSIPEVSGVDVQQKVDMPAVYVEFLTKNGGESLGTYLFSLHVTLMGKPETVTIGNRTYDVSLRFKRIYKPHTVFLKDFRFDRYMGTETAKNYSSEVVVVDPERQSERGALISMNDPLRYRGEAYFQSNFDKETETTTVLQVVKNPGWLIPYISCIVVTLGMVIHFAVTLPKRARAVMMRKDETPASSRDKLGIAIGWTVVGLLLLAAVGPLFSSPKPFDFVSAGRIPVVDRGRVKPLETLARVSLRMISGQETITFYHANGEKEKISAVKWYFEAISRGDVKSDGPAMKYPIFKVDNEQVQNELGLKNREGQRYSLEELGKNIMTIQRRASAAHKKKESERDLPEQKFYELAERIQIYTKMIDRSNALIVPPKEDGGEWRSYESVADSVQKQARDAVFQKLKIKPEELQDFEKMPEERKKEIFEAFSNEMKLTLESEPALKAWTDMVAAYRDEKPEDFNKAVNQFRETGFAFVSPADKRNAVIETIFERIGPFYWCIAFYVCAFIMMLIGTCGGPTGFQKGAYRILLAAFLLHTAALVTRIILQGRPPVTNLYSSAIFIGWAGVGLGLLLEPRFRGGYASLAGCVLGAVTTIVAHNILGTGSDTLEMMQAVLDTNIWLATHVICITLGYVATYFAGFLGLIYALQRIVAGVRNDANWSQQERTLTTMTYIVLCIAMTLSFLGTVLGGIWADQSWGRFWGWDPKENGAVLIVIWNALILHARWGGMVKGQGISVLAIIGAMVTTWSWFGTNQLGIGLHAYGFSTELAVGCAWAWVALSIIAVVGLFPKEWLSGLNRVESPAKR